MSKRVLVQSVLGLFLLCIQTGHAQALSLGPHAAVNLDGGSLHLGVDLVLQIADVSQNVKLGLWPSYAHIFVDDGEDGDLFGVDFPFIFPLDASIVTPFVGPGLGLSVFDDAQLKVNIIGGLFLETGSVRPFTELAIRLVEGTYVDLIVGVLFEL